MAKKTINKMKRSLVILAIILLVATLIEFAYFSIDKSLRNDSMSQPYFSVDDFILHEYIYANDSDDSAVFTALANNSSFELVDIGGISAETIDFFLFRDEEDTSEIVVYFSGRSGGVEGTFVAGLNRVGDRHYRATADFERVDSLRIYPSEINGSSVQFDGIAFNSVISPVLFSPFRILLWALLLAGLLCIYRLVVDAIKNRPTENLWTIVYFPLAAATALFAFLSSGLFSSARIFGDLLILLLVGIFSLFYLFLWFVAKKVKFLYKKVFLLFFAAGIVFTVATAPLQVPDESVHFARSYAIAMGSFRFEGDFDYPDDVDLLYDVFTENLNRYVKSEGHAGARIRLSDYYARLGETFSDETKAYSNQQLILPYLPSAFGILIARIFGMSALFALWLGRLANVIVAAFAASFAIKRAARWHGGLLVVIFFPLTLFMSASTSYDAIMLAALFVFLGIVASSSIKKSDFLLLAAAFAVIIMIKPLYLVIAPLIFAIPRDSFRFRGNYLIMFAILLVSSVAIWQLTLLYAALFRNNLAPSPVLPGVDKAAQLLYMIKHPLRFVAVTLIDGFRTGFYIGDFGLFGHLDLTARLTTILSPASIVATSALTSGERHSLNKKNTRIFLSIGVLIYFAVTASFYVVDSVLGSSTILGVQARYFIPLYFLITLLLSDFFAKYLRPVPKPAAHSHITSAFLLFSIAMLASLEVFFGYWL